MQYLKLFTKNLLHSLDLSRPIIKSHLEEKRAWTYASGAPQNLGVPFNISAMTEGSDFKINKRLEFAKAHNKIPPGRKSGRDPRLREFPNISGSPFIFLQGLKIAISNLVHSLGLPIRPFIKSH